MVTGSAGGLGKSMVEELCRHGASCVICDIDEVAVDRTVHEFREHGYNVTGKAVDVREEKSIEELFGFIESEYAGLDIAIANAGILRDGLLVKVDKNTGKVKGKMSLKDFRDVIDVNLTGVFLTCRQAAITMINSRSHGIIIPISSISRHGFAGQSNYSAAKAGVAAMTRLWATELSRYNIRVAGIAPGFIATQMVLDQMNQQAKEMWEKKIPIGRLGQPAEIAHTARYIIENDLVNGIVIEPHGGVAT